MFARIAKKLWSPITSNRASSKTNRRATFAQLNVEALEARNVLTSTLYIDFGDNFGTGLTGTIGGLQNTVAPGSNTNVNGPQMDDLSTGIPFANSDPFTMTSFNQIYGGAAATMRATIMTLVRRFYEPLDITVVELTAGAQIVNGVSVRGASSLNDVSLTLDANEAAIKDNDCYVLVGQMIIGAGNYNPGADGLVGIADADDLNSRSNLRDDTAVITLNGNSYSSELLAFGIAHEAGHNFGLRHTFGNFPTSAPGISNAIHESDIMSYLAGATFGGFSMFTRYPMVIGDGNSSNNVLSASPTPFDQMANDANIGAAPGVTYITGTGANDIITITRNGGIANVTVQAFNDSAYTSSINVPFFGGTTYSYSVSLANPLLIDGGARSDRFVIDASLGQQVLIRGMGGDTGNVEDADQLVISGTAASATYTPGTNSARGLDGHTDFRGTLTVGATVVRFQEFDAGSSVRMSGISSVTWQSPLASDGLIFDTVSVNGVVNQRVSGTTGGIFAVPLLFSGATSFILDSATADVGGGNDTVTVNTWVPTILGNVMLNLGDGNDTVFLSAGATAAITSLTINADAGNDNIIVTAWTPTSLTNVAFNVGTEDDTVTISAPLLGTAITAFALNGNDGNDQLNLVNFDNLSLTGGGSIAFNGGNGTDTIGVTNNVATMTLGTNTVTSSGGGTVNLTSVESAVLTGGAAANSFVVNNWTGTSATIIGGAGTDSLSISQGAVASAVFTPSNSAANGLSGTVTLPALSLSFSQFEAGSTMTMTGAAAATVQTLGGSDVLALDNAGSVTRSRVTGTTAGIAVAPLQFIGATSFTVDVGNGDSSTGNDSVSVGLLINSGLTAVVVSIGAGSDTVSFGTAFTGSTLQNVTVNGGTENDVLNVSIDNYALPVGGGAFTYDGGLGSDVMNISNNVATMTLTNASATSSSGGVLTYNSVENAALSGGAGNNTFNISAWSGSTLALNGGDGNDTFALAGGNLDVISGTTAVDGGAGTTDQLQLFDNGNALSANYTIGTANVTTVLSNGTARTFGGVSFTSAVESLSLAATTAANTFFVTPSTTTTINIDGNLPTGAVKDDLEVNFVGTGGRQITYNAGTGNGNWTFPGSGTPLFGVRKNINFLSIEKFNNQIAFGSAGSVAANTSAPVVKYVDLVSGEVVEFLAYESSFRGGVQVLTADITDATGFGAPDGIPEIIVAPGRGRAPEIRVFTSAGVELTRYRQMVYATNNLNGVNIAVGNIDADPLPELIVVPQRGVAEVRVFDIVAGNADPITNNPLYRFNAFPTNFIGGAAVGAGDLNGDGRSEIIVGSGSGIAASLVVFNPLVNFPGLIAPNAATPAAPPIAWAKYTGFFANNFLGGISSVSVGRINGDLTPDIIVGQGQGGNSLIAMLDGNSGRRQGNGSYAATTQAAAQFSAYSDTGNKSAVYAAVRDSDGDGIIDMIFTGQAADGRTKGVIRVFRPTAPLPPGVLPIFGNTQPTGVTVG